MHTTKLTSTIFLVDWDIPVSKNRFRFYRALKRLKEEMGLHGAMSSMSVLITYDEELARRVFNLASEFTSRVHLYKAEEVV